MKQIFHFIIFLTALSFSACGQTKTTKPSNTSEKQKREVVKSEEEWKKILTPEQYEVTRQKGTERAFTGKYWNTKDKGKYYCVACNNFLFESNVKFESSCGWPSFYEASNKNGVEEHEDNSYGMSRTEVVCKRCGSHLGHVFDDGPPPTGLRYCINSEALRFEPAK